MPLAKPKERVPEDCNLSSLSLEIYWERVFQTFKQGLENLDDISQAIDDLKPTLKKLFEDKAFTGDDVFKIIDRFFVQIENLLQQDKLDDARIRQKLVESIIRIHFRNDLLTVLALRIVEPLQIPLSMDRLAKARLQHRLVGMRPFLQRLTKEWNFAQHS